MGFESFFYLFKTKSKTNRRHILVGVLHRTLRTVLTRPGLIPGSLADGCND